MTGRISLTTTHHEAGPVATVTVDNPAKANTLNTLLMHDFIETFATLSNDKDLRAVILTGAGPRTFMGGADIREMATLDGPEAARAFITRLHRCCAAVRDCPVPVIARIQGPCFGAGLELVASCDLRLAADTARFAMPEVRLGIPSVIEAALLPGQVGWGRTRHMLYLAEPFTAAQAERWGLIEQSVPVQDLDTTLAAWLKSLLASPPGAIRAQKALMRKWEHLPIHDAIQAGIEAFAAAYATNEPRQAMANFTAPAAPARFAR